MPKILMVREIFIERSDNYSKKIVSSNRGAASKRVWRSSAPPKFGALLTLFELGGRLCHHITAYKDPHTPDFPTFASKYHY